MESFDSQAQSYAEDMKATKRQILEKFIDPDTLKVKEKAPQKYVDDFKVSCPSILDKHKKFLDDIFKMLINNMAPLKQLKYWSVLDKNYTRDYRVIKNFHKCSKYKISEYKEKHAFTLVDEYIASYHPDETQFKFLKAIIHKEARTKSAYQSAINLLLEAKEIIETATWETYNNSCVFIKSGLISDDQYLNSIARDRFAKEEDGFANIWNIQVDQKKYNFDLTTDESLGPYAAKYLDPKDHTNEISYNHYSLKAN